MVETGTATFKARARLMLILGEQLITDEVAAVSELVKNSYDADSPVVTVSLKDVSNPAKGEIVITDKGIGMTKETVLGSWLELGTLSKSPEDATKRKSPGGRPYLGEKGIGRLAVHKLGKKTEITTRSENSNSEFHLIIDWSQFEKARDKYLEDMSIKWEERPPTVFTKKTDAGTKGTEIRVTELQRAWTPEIMSRMNLAIEAMTSPYAGLKGFDVKLVVDDPEKPTTHTMNFVEYLSTATYEYDVEVNANGFLTGSYEFNRPDATQLNRKVAISKQILDPGFFKLDFETRKPRKPTSGPFTFRLFAWELYPGDKKRIFGESAIYDQIIRPSTGVRVFRDGFRVLPYGNRDDDWLSLDARRVASFAQHVSRSQSIGLIDITSARNPLLRDKSDREGLISNQAFSDFKQLVLDSLQEFEVLRLGDHNALNTILKRTRKGRLEKITTTIDRINELLKDVNKSNSNEVVKEIRTLLSTTQQTFDEVLSETEEPLLVAAAIGLTYMVPTHEVRRDLQQIKQLVARAAKTATNAKSKSDLDLAWRLANRGDSIVAGIANILRKGRMITIPLSRVIQDAEGLIEQRLESQSVKIETSLKPISIKGSERLLVTALLNLLENSAYWLQTVDTPKRLIRVIVDKLQDGSPALIVTDSGPGLTDDLDVLAQPFVTRKPDGMGLGLYIVERVALAHNARLRSFEQNEVKGLLSGASVGIVFPRRSS
jgi:signal transduction histidine kinase